MKTLIFPLILWLLCVTQGLILQLPQLEIPMLAGLIYGAVGLYLSPRWRILATSIFYTLCLLHRPLLLFLPLAAYLHYESQKSARLLLTYSWIPMLLLSGQSFLALISLSLLCLLGLLLAYGQRAASTAQQRYFSLQDTSVEEARLLKQQNQFLQEKQDYQIKLATLGERSRLAREIHDNVGHLLTRSLFQISALQISQPDLAEPLAQIKDTLSEAMDSIRASVHGLHDQSLDLELEIQRLADAFHYCPITLRYHSAQPPVAIHYCLLAIIKEALSNIARHSGATQAHISLLEHPGLYQLVIEDNGGAAAKSSRLEEAPGGIGLYNIRQRVDELQGSVQIERSKGFRLLVSIPKLED